jgi:hypothetical protein
VIQLVALAAGTLAGLLPHLISSHLLGIRLGVFADFLLGSIVGGAAYVLTIYRLKKLRGDF